MELSIKEYPLIMGILNITPDSFYDGNKYYEKGSAIARAYQIRDEGADIIDIGGLSTRPGSEGISIPEEIDRVCPVIEAIKSDIGIPISIDTYNSSVAEAAIASGASIINDISGFTFDSLMPDVALKHEVTVVLMHIKGTPGNMQNDPRYENLLEEIFQYLRNAVDTALSKGIAREKIIIDPGIGFGKTLEDNYQIVNNIQYFKKMGFPVLIGLSRKSLIAKLYSIEEDRLPATVALNSISILNGADIIRVHDVKAHSLALKAINKLMSVAEL